MANPSQANLARVDNWLHMMQLCYKKRDGRLSKIYRDTKYGYRRSKIQWSPIDTDVRICKVSDKSLVDVYKDLAKRKYNFQYKKTPKDHVKFMAKLEKEIHERCLDDYIRSRLCF